MRNSARFFSSRAEIFNLECFVQKYWSGYCYMSLEYFLKPWKMRQNNELHADLESFLFNCARKNAFLGVRAEILLSRVIAPRESCAGPFLGVVQKYKIWRNIHL